MSYNAKTIIIIWLLYFTLVGCNEASRRDFSGYEVYDAETLVRGTDTIVLTVSERTELRTHFRIGETL